MTHDVRVATGGIAETGDGMLVARVWTERVITITERETRDTGLGRAQQVKVWSSGYPVLTWREVQEAFTAAYPGKWAVQVLPPASEVVDTKNVYHLWVLESEPDGLNLR